MIKESVQDQGAGESSILVNREGMQVFVKLSFLDHILQGGRLLCERVRIVIGVVRRVELLDQQILE